ncbi:ankyrin, partial [Amniculicola lignicola CBS 123094]
GDMKLIEKLVKEGVNISAINDSGESALSKAISRRQINVARFLLENGATTEYPGFLVEKPLFSAVSTGNVKLVQLLLDHDADIDECSSVGTVLSKAAKAGQEDIVALLLSRDADVNLFNHLVYAPLYGAVTQNNDRLVRELLKHGAETGI